MWQISSIQIIVQTTQDTVVRGVLSAVGGRSLRTPRFTSFKRLETISAKYGKEGLGVWEHSLLHLPYPRHTQWLAMSGAAANQK